MVTVTIPKQKYQQLERQASAYRRFAAQIFESQLGDPINEVIKDFRKTDLYTGDFLKDLESGLRRSSYARQHGHKAVKR